MLQLLKTVFDSPPSASNTADFLKKSQPLHRDLERHREVGEALYRELDHLQFQGTRERQVTPGGHDATAPPVCESTLLKPDFEMPGGCIHLHANLLPADRLILMRPPGFAEAVAWADACISNRVSCLVDLDAPEKRQGHCMNRGTTTWGAARYRVDFERAANANPTSGSHAEANFEVSLLRAGQDANTARTQRVRRLQAAPMDPHDPLTPQRMLDLVKAIDDEAQGDGEAVAFQCADDHASALMAVALSAYRRLKRGDEPSIDDLNDFVFNKCAEVRAYRNVDIFESLHLTTLVAFNHLALAQTRRGPPTAARRASGDASALREDPASASAVSGEVSQTPAQTKLQAIRADITTLSVDAIVNAAKPSLLGGGGVDRAIHQAAGKDLLKACKPLGGCDTGDAKVTRAFLLPALYVVHTVGPKWQNGHRDEASLLASCYRRSLEEASRKGARSVAFPCISTGSYGFPAPEAAQIAVRTVTDFLTRSTSIKEVIFCCSSDRHLELYLQELDKLPA